MGWIVWRGVEYLPKELIFELHYLGEVSRFVPRNLPRLTEQTDYSFNLNFSRPAHPILGQMFNCEPIQLATGRQVPFADLLTLVLNLGFAGYRRIMQNDLTKARLVSRALEH